jgi:formate dehydrogenase subunit beta
MMERYQISKDDFLGLLRYLLEKKMVDEILSGIENKNRYNQKPEFINDSKKLTDYPLSQLLVYSYGRTDSAANTMLHSHEGLKKKVAVIGHACDIRALVELSKKLQSTWENLFLITFEDHGFVEVKNSMKFFKAAAINDAEIIHERLTLKHLIFKMKNNTIKKFELGKEINICDNCARCVGKSHHLADMIISTYGLSEESTDFIITPQSDRAKKIIQEFGWPKKQIDDKLNSAYEAEAKEIIEKCSNTREIELSKWANEEKKLEALSKCTGCGLCVTSCPVCFCVSCNLLPQVKAKEMSTLTFLMTRFSHVGDTCIECGRCGSNCPVNIPLTLVFQTLRDKFKSKRNYEAGANLTSKPLHLDI